MAHRAPPPAGAAQSDIADFLCDLGARKEFQELAAPSDEERAHGKTLARQLGLGRIRAYIPPEDGPEESSGVDGDADEYLPRITELHLHDLQVFVDRYFNPNSLVSRFLLCWDTGLGKTIAAITIAQNFARQFAARTQVPAEERPTVFIIGFTRAIIQAEMLRSPKHGFISMQQLSELRRLRNAAADAAAAGVANSPAGFQYHGYLGTLKRNLTDRLRDGYYQFYGYREFASQLFIITRKGEAAGLKVTDLFQRPSFTRKPPADAGASASAGSDDPEITGDEDSTDPMEIFVRRIAEAEHKQYLRVNTDLISRMRQGLIVADEIHNVYNVHEPNMYGVAIQFVLDVFPPNDAPRAVFMSATPMSGSPTEVVDILNLLVPRHELPDKRPLQPGDLFRRASGGSGGSTLTAYELLPGALDKITKISAGRTSFMTISMAERDPHDLIFPRTEYLGSVVAGPNGKEIPYLKFVEAPYSDLQEKAIAEWRGDNPRRALVLPGASDYAIYDLVFPVPSGGVAFTSTSAAPITQVLASASDEWKRKSGVQVLPGSIASGRNVPVAAGEWLAMPALAKYSGKYAKFVEDLHAYVKRGTGKILAYHDRVQVTGVSLLAQILRLNGFAPMDEPPIASTLCSVCGVVMSRHKKVGGANAGAGASRGKQHQFVPARFGVVTGAMDSGSKERTLNAFNLASNLDGHVIRVLIGSQVIIEGLNFSAVRWQAVLSIPRNISTLVQILGRAVRRGSHSALPPDQREVKVSIYVNSARSFAPPDVVKVAHKMRDFVTIQMEMNALRLGAVNSFLPQVDVLAKEKPSLRGLPFRPVVPFSEVQTAEPKRATYYAYQHATSDMGRIRYVLRILFSRRPVWTREELVEAVQNSVVQDQSINPAHITEGLLDYTLYHMTRTPPSAARTGGPSGRKITAAETSRIIAAHLTIQGEPRRLVVMNSGSRVLYMAVGVDQYGNPIRDVESFLRKEPRRMGGSTRGDISASVNLAMYTQTHLRASNFDKRLVEFEARYALKRPSEYRSMLVEYPADFHYTVLERICTLLIQRRKLSSVMENVHCIYKKYKVMVSIAKLRRVDAQIAAKLPKRLPDDTSVGFVTKNAVRIVAAQKISLPLSQFGVGPRQEENNIAIGYMEGGSRDASTSSGKFKIRDPIQSLGIELTDDTRTLARGAVCETRPRDKQLTLAKKLLGVVVKSGRKVTLNGSAVATRDLAGMSSAELCSVVLDALLTEEAAARTGRDGMITGTRWFYLFNDTRPAIRSKGSSA